MTQFKFISILLGALISSVCLAEDEAKKPVFPNGEGTYSVGGMPSYSNVQLKGEAACVLFETMSDAKEVSQKSGGLHTTTIRMGENLMCTSNPEVKRVCRCQMSVNSKGAARPELLRGGSKPDEKIELVEPSNDSDNK